MAKRIPNYDPHEVENPFADLPTFDISDGKPKAAPVPSYEEVAALIREKFSATKLTDSDMTDGLRLFANEWISNYEGDFSFLLDMSTRRSLSVGQQRGILNCIRSEVLRAKNTGGAPEAKRIVEDGMYQTPDGTILKVQIAHHGSGNLYAKQLFINPETKKATFRYAAGALRELTPEMRMTLEQAKAFGRLYGVCCKCGAILTDEQSIADGIGPICGSKGW